MAIRKTAETPCDLRAGDIFPPEEVAAQPRLACRAVYLEAAAGVKYTGELGLPDAQRTQRVLSLSQNICSRLIEQGKCPAPQV